MKGFSVGIALLLAAALVMAGCGRRRDEEQWWLGGEEEPGGEGAGLVGWALRLMESEDDLVGEEPGLADWGLEEEDGLVYEIDEIDPFTGTLDEQWLNGRKKHVETGFRDGVPYGKVTEWEDYGFQQRRETEFLDGRIISYREWDARGNLVTEWLYW